MEKLLLPLVLAALITPFSYAQTPAASAAMQFDLARSRIVESDGPLTLSTALELAFRANPEIVVAAREVQALEGALRQAG
jgi:cobalt-zinc-cadmium efflux system outer membrane protein